MKKTYVLFAENSFLRGENVFTTVRELLLRVKFWRSGWGHSVHFSLFQFSTTSIVYGNNWVVEQLGLRVPG